MAIISTVVEIVVYLISNLELMALNINFQIKFHKILEIVSENSLFSIAVSATVFIKRIWVPINKSPNSFKLYF